MDGKLVDVWREMKKTLKNSSQEEDDPWMEELILTDDERAALQELEKCWYVEIHSSIIPKNRLHYVPGQSVDNSHHKKSIYKQPSPSFDICRPSKCPYKQQCQPVYNNPSKNINKQSIMSAIPPHHSKTVNKSSHKCRDKARTNYKQTKKLQHYQAVDRIITMRGRPHVHGESSGHWTTKMY